MTNGEIKKIFKDHGNPAIETPRGQIAVTPEILSKLTDVIASPDNIRLANNPQTRDGKPVLQFEKRINGYAIYIQAVSDKGKKLRPVTFYAINKKKPPTMSNAISPAQNVQDASGTVSLDPSVAQSPAGVNNQYMQSDAVNAPSVQPTPQTSIAPQPTAQNDKIAMPEVKADANEILGKLRQSIPDMVFSPPVKQLTGTEFFKGDVGIVQQVGDFFKSLGNKVTRPNFGDVIIDERSVKSDIAHGLGRAKAVTFAAVPEVIAQGKQIDYQQNWKGRSYDTYVFAAPVFIGGQRTYVTTIVRSDGKNSLYLHEVLDANGNILYTKKEEPSRIKTGVTAMDGITGGLDSSGRSPLSFKTGVTAMDGITGGQVPIDPSIAQSPTSVNNQYMQNGAGNAARPPVQSSQSLSNIISKLQSGNDVPLSEIDSIPEISEVRAQIGDMEQTSNINTPERNAQRAEVLKTLNSMGSASIDTSGNVAYNGIVRQDRRADIVIGLPAAGKSSVLADPLSQEHHSRIIDSDMAKELLPEFNNGLGASRVHEESKMIAKKWLEYPIDNGDNIVYPIVGSNLQKVLSQIQYLKESGYSVNLHLNELPSAKATGRAIQRFLDTGRFVDPSIVKSYGNKPTEVYNAIRQMEGLLDGYSRYSNDVAKGQRSALIERSENLGDLSGGSYGAIRESGLSALNVRIESSQRDAGAAGQSGSQNLSDDSGNVRRRSSHRVNQRKTPSTTEQPQINASAGNSRSVSDWETNAAQNATGKVQQYQAKQERWVVKKLANAFSIPKTAQKNDIMPVVHQIAEEIRQGGTLSNQSMERLFNAAYDSGVKTLDDYYNTYKPVRDQLRNTRVTLPAKDRAGITDYNDEHFVGIQKKHSEINKKYATSPGNLAERNQKAATEFSKYIDGLMLPKKQNDAVRDKFKYWNMTPASPEQYSGGALSESNAKLWAYPEVKKAIGSVQDFIKIQDLINSIKADKDEYGASINGTGKSKEIEAIAKELKVSTEKATGIYNELVTFKHDISEMTAKQQQSWQVLKAKNMSEKDYIKYVNQMQIVTGKKDANGKTILGSVKENRYNKLLELGMDSAHARYFLSEVYKYKWK